MRIIGIDTGLRTTGYAIIETNKILKCGICETTEKMPLAERLKVLYDGMKMVMQEYSPEIAVYETVFYKQNFGTFSKLSHARGVLLLAAADMGIKIKEYSPAEIKMAVTGNGRASKDQIHSMVERLTGMKILPSLDVGDALACALCYRMREENSRIFFSRIK
ncbi:MAG: crossover junction endodeoxyribonuclease RuvC [bacterium]